MVLVLLLLRARHPQVRYNTEKFRRPLPGYLVGRVLAGEIPFAKQETETDENQR